MNIIVLAELVEESRLSEAARSEERVSKISLTSLRVLDVSTESINVWDPIWKLQLLQILNVKSDQVGK